MAHVGANTFPEGFGYSESNSSIAIEEVDLGIGDVNSQDLGDDITSLKLLVQFGNILVQISLQVGEELLGSDGQGGLEVEQLAKFGV